MFAQKSGLFVKITSTKIGLHPLAKHVGYFTKFVRSKTSYKFLRVLLFSSTIQSKFKSPKNINLSYLQVLCADQFEYWANQFVQLKDHEQDQVHQDYAAFEWPSLILLR